MISKLKRKFTILATVSMFILMAVLILIMNIVNYTSVISESDAVLELLSHTDNPFTDKDSIPNKLDEHLLDIIPGDMSPEVPYESRYFTVMIGPNGEVKDSDLSKIVSVDSDSAQQYITKAINKDRNRGFINQFRYLKNDDGVVQRIVFLDCGRRLDAFYTFLWTSIFVGLFGCLVVFVAFLFVSGRIVKPIAEGYEKQKRFISDAGHEIKTPLTIINTYVDLLECDDETDDMKEELDEIKAQTKRLTDLTNNLVTLSKMEETEHKIQKISIPLSDIIAESSDSFKKVAEANGIAYSESIDANITINGSPDSIRQMITILLDNAVKYAPNGGMITVGLTTNKKSAVIKVFNTTKILINEENLAHVFERFYRTDQSRNSQTGGHGIGLSIAKAITEAHDGNIHASTENGYDFCITAEIPL